MAALPRWRGFNLLELFWANTKEDFNEDHFKWMADWGFDFVRLPMNYRLWTVGDDVYRIDESTLEIVDRAIDLGDRYNLHICLSFHNAPGYSVNPQEQPFNLWKDEAALNAFCWHWMLFTKRYKRIPSEKLSFNLVNEPPVPSDDIMTLEDHDRVIQAAVASIHEIDPKRQIIIDALSKGNEPVPGMDDLPVAQSCRGYLPESISHYLAPWADGGMDYPPPVWPEKKKDGLDNPMTRKKLEKHYQTWGDLAAQGVGVHCGECGCHNQTPHDVFLKWFRDVLEILKAHDIGYALWNLRGEFGILDSGRDDVDYVDWYGHKLDQKLLELLQEF